MTLLVAILGMTYLNACSEDSNNENPMVENPTDTIPAKDTTMLPKPDTLYYLALGDSYTIGESVKTEERYPVQLVTQLRKDSIVIADPTIIARTGWTTGQLKQAIENATLRTKYDLISLLIGVNNQYQNINIEVYKTEFRALLQKAILLAGGDKSRVFVVSIPDYAYTPFGQRNPSISKGVDEYNTINADITKQLGVAYFDITPISREGFNDPTLVASDGLHPSGKMYGHWVALFYNEIVKKLKN